MPRASLPPSTERLNRRVDVQLKRAYCAASETDGLRVLVDRLWPRGLIKAESRIDEWAREVAPTQALRKWFNHDPKRWDEFCIRYERELADHPRRIQRLRHLARDGRITLIYAARDEVHNHAVVLRNLMLAAGRTR